MKYKDLGYPTIFIVTGDQLIHRALLDLRASNNTLYQVWLGELKPTKMVIQLVDRLTTLPRGVVQDAQIKVDEFINPVDIVVLVTEK